MHGPPGQPHHHTHDARVAWSQRRRIAAALCLSSVYMVAEFAGGWWTNSLALIADAGHRLTDVAALALSFFAVWIAARPAPPQRTYGYYRAEILAALVNGAALFALSGMILWEAAHRFGDPREVTAPLMVGIAVGGLLINLISLAILHGGREASLNIKGAWLHVLMDALGSVVVILAGIAIWAFGWVWFDPLASVVIVLFVTYSAWRLLAEAVSVLMENAPRGMDVDEVWQAMRDVAGVEGVHDLHVWTITSGLDSLSAHVVTSEVRPHAELLRDLRDMLHDRFGIDHITIQIEPIDFAERETPV